MIKNIPSPEEWFEFNSMYNVKLPGWVRQPSDKI